jgi:hypothetical protein
MLKNAGIARVALMIWEIVCSPKYLGGLGVLNSDLMNLS